jgi:hypothetical protein
VPQYLVPEIVLDRLSDGAYCRENRCGHRQDKVLRPFASAALIADRQGESAQVCALDRPSGEACALAARQSRYLQKKVFELME